MPRQPWLALDRVAELAVHVLDEAGAVEAARGRTGPDVRDAEVAQRDRRDAAAAAGLSAERHEPRGEHRIARLLLQRSEARVGGGDESLEPVHARLRGAPADAQQHGVLVRLELIRQECGAGRGVEEPTLGVLEPGGLRAGCRELRFGFTKLYSGRIYFMLCDQVGFGLGDCKQPVV